MAVEGRLDLHGMTQAEAHPALTDFLAGAQDAGKRCVLVITGKGLRPDGRAGVLRDAVPGWLNSPPNRRRILSFTPATPADGGTGALYILLKRLKRL
jgi:DNA-nicking Smr family endonuclease